MRAMNVTSFDRRWLIRFGIVLSALVGFAIFSTMRLPSFREPAFDFYAMKDKDLFIAHGLTRRQEGAMKVGFAENFAPPEIGMYGNHSFQFFGADAFDKPADPSDFFNYWYANLSLPEIYRYLRHMEDAGRLPKKTILVQITTPNNDNGLHIINWGHELPPSLLFISTAGEGVFAKAWRLTGTVGVLVQNWLHEVFNYNTFILGLLQQGPGSRVIDPQTCKSPEEAGDRPAWIRRLPLTVQDMFNLEGGNLFCQRRMWWRAFRRDGSNESEFADETVIQNGNALLDSHRALKTGDETKIAEIMRAINDIGKRNDRKVVFIVPPVYETDRHDSVVNEIFNRGVALAPELTVLDHRRLNANLSLFKRYDHPSPKYFRLVADELRKMGIVQ
jgi:hypothetical protein